ncbi:MBL fold metallo-hydrolase [Archangium lansingense]|uniref:MBL fold metallo-hydrolase n=1 Tax=Archangium lansingense TaxID=2995310 RepID=A0ABT4A801_9BACT|nr:MBL fold metallo-hydrolase [Archangium lansinium]MCY1077788.1 MBL fold metallo-hydrolase [Archangium lansinium]
MDKERIGLHPETSVSVKTWMDTLCKQWSPMVLQAAQAIVDGKPFAQVLSEVTGKHAEATSFFTAGPDGQDFRLRDELMFPAENRVVEVQIANTATRRVIRFDPGEDTLLPAIAGLLWRCACGRMSADEIRQSIDEELVELFDSLLEDGFLQAAREIPNPRFSKPGLHRLQHASLLHRSQSSGVLIDPQFHSSMAPSARHPLLRSDVEGLVDAIVISHWHEDHFNLATLMMFPPETTLIVPRVPRASMICDHMANRLRSCGFTDVRELEWFSEPVRVGDIEIAVLPFYGEQPLRDGPPRHPELRNWGNTYLFRSMGTTSWVLVDSGNDVRGTMAGVADEVLERFGPVDFVLSNLREFAPFAPEYITATGTYWLSLPPEQMRRFRSLKNQLLTLGPTGVAEVCQRVRARHFLPYAHWWHEPGTIPGDGEETMVRTLQHSLANLGAPTTVLPWRVADHLSTNGVCSG